MMFFTEAVDEIVRRLQRDRDDRDGEASGTPYGHEHQMLNALPARILQLPSDRARTLWEPILALGTYAHYWVDTFSRAWFRTGLDQSGTIPPPSSRRVGERCSTSRRPLPNGSTGATADASSVGC